MPMQVLSMLIPSASTDYRYSKLIDGNDKHILEASYVLMAIPDMYNILLSQTVMAYSQRSPTIESCSVALDSLQCHGTLQARILEEWVALPFSRDLPKPRIKPRSPALQVDSLPAKTQGKPKNTVVGRLFLLQWIFLTQELTQRFLHCRKILCQMSYQGSSNLFNNCQFN